MMFTLEEINILWSVHQEMDIESLEAANQSLQVDLKLAFKRIGDLQAAIEDEMESDDNDDLINRCGASLVYKHGSLWNEMRLKQELLFFGILSITTYSILSFSSPHFPPDHLYRASKTHIFSKHKKALTLFNSFSSIHFHPSLQKGWGSSYLLPNWSKHRVQWYRPLKWTKLYIAVPFGGETSVSWFTLLFCSHCFTMVTK